MNFKPLKIILIILAIIIALVIMFVIYTIKFAHIPDKGGMENDNIVGTENTLTEPEEFADITYEDSVTFCNLTVGQWKEKISRYNNCEIEDIQIRCVKGTYYATAVNSETNEVIADYEFEEETGYAYDKISGDLVDLMEGFAVEKKLTEGAKIEFLDNQILALAYAPDPMLAEFVETYFYDEDDFKMLHVYDFRRDDTVEEFERFVLIPKTSDVKIEIYDCFINDNGELELDNKLYGDAVGGLVILDDIMGESFMPELCIKLQYKGFEEIVPISFSGMDGKLNLTGFESEVKDITIYPESN